MIPQEGPESRCPVERLLRRFSCSAPNDAADRHHYLIVIATDGDTRPPDPASVLDDRLRGVPALYAARALGERLGRGDPGWGAVVVRLGR